MPHNTDDYFDDIPRWQLYERVVQTFDVENVEYGMNPTATPNASIVGSLSGAKRQIDLLIEARWEDLRERRMIVDAKNHQRKLDIKTVEEFEGMMRDCRADYGVIVCSNGWTPAAKRRAQESITLRLLSLEDALTNTEWGRFDECLGACRAKPDPKKRGWVLWNGELLLTVDGLYAIIYTGKCDICRSFQVWCWDCGETFSIRRGRQTSCYCGRSWKAQTIKALDHSGVEVADAVELVLRLDGSSMVVDRRSLR